MKIADFSVTPLVQRMDDPEWVGRAFLGLPAPTLVAMLEVAGGWLLSRDPRRLTTLLAGLPPGA